MIELEWTHDPAAYGGWVRHETAPGRCLKEWPEGWVTVLARGDDGPRCGAFYPGNNGKNGSCAAAPGHEHPHVWGVYGWHLESISRRTRVEGLVA